MHPFIEESTGRKTRVSALGSGAAPLSSSPSVSKMSCCIVVLLVPSMSLLVPSMLLLYSILFLLAPNASLLVPNMLFC